MDFTSFQEPEQDAMAAIEQTHYRRIHGNPQFCCLCKLQQHPGPALYPCDRNDGLDFVQMPFRLHPYSSDHWNFIMVQLQELQDMLRSTTSSTSISKHVEETIQKFASKTSNFGILHKCLAATSRRINERLLEYIIERAVALPQLIQLPIPLLRSGHNMTLVMTTEQAQSLLANAFFSTFPGQAKNYQEFNFAGLMNSSKHARNETKVEKLKCIMNYFHQMSTPNAKDPQQQPSYLTFERRCLKPTEIPDWSSSKTLLTQVHIGSGKIEDCGSRMLQVDFANKYVGGGVLGHGSVMEEIRFATCPELIVSLLFAEKLSDLEVLILTGATQFSSYRGYGGSFQFAGNFNDTAGIDNLGRRAVQLVAMDALSFTEDIKWEQFRAANIHRELNKCFSAFMKSQNDFDEGYNDKPIASGNWGCGVFNGHPELKFLIQLLAASQAQRSLVMFLPGKKELANSIIATHRFLTQQQVTVGKLFQILHIIGQQVIETRGRPTNNVIPVFDLILTHRDCLQVIQGA